MERGKKVKEVQLDNDRRILEGFLEDYKRFTSPTLPLKIGRLRTELQRKTPLVCELVSKYHGEHSIKVKSKDMTFREALAGSLIDNATLLAAHLGIEAILNESIGNIDAGLRPLEVKLAANSAMGTDATVIVKVRKELFMNMYEIAKEHRDLAKKAAGNNMNGEINESMITVLFSYTCLEAYINTVGKDKLGNEWKNYEGSSTEAKWKGVSKALATKKIGRFHSVFNDKEDPFKSFLDLEEIREDYLVHRKAEFSDVVETKYGRTEGTIGIFNCDKAGWACETVKNMVAKLNASIDNPPPATWLD